MTSPAARLREKRRELARAEVESAFALPGEFGWCDTDTEEKVLAAAVSVAERRTRVMQRWPRREELEGALREASTRASLGSDPVYLQILDRGDAGLVTAPLVSALEFVASRLDRLSDGVLIVSPGDEVLAFVVDVEPDDGSTVTTLNGAWPTALLEPMAEGPAPIEVLG